MPRPVSAYFGGKQEFIDFYFKHTPIDGVQTAVEVCGGMAAWTLMREPYPNDIINDAYEFIPDLFKAIRDHPQELARAISGTPHALAEWRRARTALGTIAASRRAGNATTENIVEVARLFLTVLRQSLATAPGESWSRIIDHSRRGMCSSCSRWIDAPESIIALADRLKTVQIECMEFDDCINKYDRESTLFFIDPPYLESVRKTKANTYMREFTLQDHTRLLDLMRRVKGQVMLCGYDHPMYNRVLKGWEKYQYKVHARTNIKNNGGKGSDSHRVETLWVKRHKPEQSRKHVQPSM